ncbi:MAG: metallopeptidase family protein [Chloroflexi bacterium]|nr:metallopeptidase family protein [Chloroflexota bacterium]
MSRRRFERLVARAVRDLPPRIRERLDNVEIVIADWPTREDLAAAGLDEGETLFGLYQGIPLTGRTTSYGFALPDKITIFQGPIEEACRSDWAIRQEVQRTVLHELAHHLGFSDDDLARFGLE